MPIIVIYHSFSINFLFGLDFSKIVVYY